VKIKAIKASAINIPTLKSYHVAVMGTVNSTQSVIVEVYTDEGLTGRIINENGIRGK
jgi:L-alanine-DL-glutamate epimerase-like enolase superfamily enzyme